jgi:hypothetical protein
LTDDIVRGRPYFFAKQLHSYLENILARGTDAHIKESAHEGLQRILVCRMAVDLTDIVDEYNAMFGDLLTKIKISNNDKEEKDDPRMKDYADLVEYAKRNKPEKVAESVSRHLKLKSNPHIDDPDVD